MKTTLSRNRILLLLVTFGLLMSCKKDQEPVEEEQTKEKMTLADLQGTSGKRWTLRLSELIWYNDQGGVDSTTALRNGDGESDTFDMWFGDGQYFVGGSLEVLIRPIGEFTLDEGTQVLTMKCLCDLPADDPWTITNFKRLTEFDGEFILERTQISSGRKLEQKLIFW